MNVILTGFMGISVDKEGWIRPQMGWSVHLKDYEKDTLDVIDTKKWLWKRGQQKKMNVDHFFTGKTLEQRWNIDQEEDGCGEYGEEEDSEEKEEIYDD